MHLLGLRKSARAHVSRLAAAPIFTSCFVLVTLSGATLGCSSSPESLAVASDSIIYGEDGRREYYEVAETLEALTARQSIVVFLPKGTLDLDSAALMPDTPDYGSVNNLCPGERFADQPAAAFCSGVLLDWDLVLTAGHCVRLLPLSKTLISFGYYYERPGALALSPDDIYWPEEIVAEAMDPATSDERLDYAWVRLDRPVIAPHRPAPVHIAMSLAAKEPTILSIGAPGGVPLKIEQGGHVWADRPDTADYFGASTDTSHGSSGGGAFDAARALLGILVRGGDDHQKSTDAECSATHIVADESAGDEEFTYAHRAVEGLCARDGRSSLCRANCESPCQALDIKESPLVGGCSIQSQVPIGSAKRLIIGLLCAIGLRLRCLALGRSKRRSPTLSDHTVPVAPG